MTKWHVGSNSRGSFGMALTEVLIAAALVTVAALATTYFLVQSKRSSVGLEGDSTCQQRADFIVAQFKNLDNKLYVNSWHPTTAQLSPPTSLTHPERLYAAAPILPTTAMQAITYSDINTWELLDNGTNAALSLYNQAPIGTVWCTTASPPGKQLTPNYTILTNSPITITPPALATGSSYDGSTEKMYLNVQLYDFSQNKALTCGSTVLTAGQTIQRIIPKGSNPNGSAVESNLGVLLTATVSYTDHLGRNLSCNSSAVLRPEGDSTPPAPMNPALFVSSILTQPTGGGYCPSCCMTSGTPISPICLAGDQTGRFVTYPSALNPPVGCGKNTNPLAMSFQAAVSEAASVFTCALVQKGTQALLPGPTPPPGTNFYNCANYSALVNPSDPAALQKTVSMTVTQPWASPTPAPYGPPGVTALQIDINNLPDGFYRLYLRTFDSAQNQSDTSIAFGVDITRPDTNVLAPPRPFIEEFAQAGPSPVGPPWGAPAWGHQPVNSPFNTAVAFPSPGYYQCSTAPDIFYWTMSGSNSNKAPDVALDGGMDWAIDGTLTQNQGLCTPGVLSPGNEPTNTTHTVSAIPCDGCWAADIPSPSPSPISASFYVDLNGAITANHSPSTFPAADFAPNSDPTWTFASAKSPEMFAYTCEGPASTLTQLNSGGSLTCATAGFSTFPCTDQNASGFCTRSFDVCGRTSASTPTLYQVQASAGQSCGNVDCGAGLTCGLDLAYKCVCVANKACTSDADCGGLPNNICFNAPTGTCHGVGPGPGTGDLPLGAAAVCPALTTSCGYGAVPSCGGASPTPAPTPTPTPYPSPTASPFSCVQQTNKDCVKDAVSGKCSYGGSYTAAYYIPGHCTTQMGKCPASCVMMQTDVTCSAPINPCPVLMPPGAFCTAGNQCMSGVCGGTGTCQ